MVDVVDCYSEKIFRSFIGLFLSSIKSPGFLMFLKCVCVRFQNCVSSFRIFLKNLFLFCDFCILFCLFFWYLVILYFVYKGYLQGRIFFGFS